jgi:hypothetical protein
MSRENIEAFKRALEAANRRDVDALLEELSDCRPHGLATGRASFPRSLRGQFATNLAQEGKASDDAPSLRGGQSARQRPP